MAKLRIHEPQPGCFSARLLLAVIEGSAEAEKAICEAIHRTQVWNYSTGRRKPTADTIGRLSHFLPANGWSDDKREPSASDVAEAIRLVTISAKPEAGAA